MYELSLFPLNTVLFPGMPLGLHIFEDRYKLLISECLRFNKPFGVVLIEKGHEAHGPLAQPFLIGCTARIVKMEPLDQGKMNITSVGVERFRILKIAGDKPYLTATVEPFALRTGDTDRVKLTAKKLNSKLEQYLELLARAGNLEFDRSQIPDNPEDLAYVAASILQTQTSIKQTLLESEDLEELIQMLNLIYRRELILLELMVIEPSSALSRGFSSN